MRVMGGRSHAEDRAPLGFGFAYPPGFLIPPFLEVSHRQVPFVYSNI
jgi:hypothetical protein